MIDPYREACRIGTTVGGTDLALPFMVTGFDDAPAEVRAAVGRGIAEADASYLGVQPVGEARAGSSSCCQGKSRRARTRRG